MDAKMIRNFNDAPESVREHLRRCRKVVRGIHEQVGDQLYCWQTVQTWRLAIAVISTPLMVIREKARFGIMPTHEEEQAVGRQVARIIEESDFAISMVLSSGSTKEWNQFVDRSVDLLKGAA